MKAIGKWIDDRTGLITGLGRVANAVVPPGRGIKLLPCAIIFTFFLQASTGVVLWLYYSASTQTAWESIFYVQYVVPGGWMIRGVHHYSAQLLSALLGIYILSLILSGSYRKKREFVLWTVMIMLAFSLGSCLTGDLLTWSTSGYSATQVRVNLLNHLPFGLGDWLHKLAIGGPPGEFGTMSLTRFLVLHVLVFGGGFFGVGCLWRWCELKSRKLIIEIPNEKSFVPFWNNEVLKSGLVCIFVMGIVLLLVYQKPILKKTHPNLPREASLGAEMYPPGGPGPENKYDAARPEWQFRALYHLANLEKTEKAEDGSSKKVQVFPGSKKYIPIFLITGGTAAFFFLIPIIGQIKFLHWFNVLGTLAVFGGFCWLTYDSYGHDTANEQYHKDVKKAEALYERSIELALRPEGIPPAGVLSIIQKDVKIQGRILFERHCSSCHDFSPADGVEALADFPPIPCDKPTAPNLYNPITAEWMHAFMDAKRIDTGDFFGNTAFKGKTMSDYTRTELKEALAYIRDEEKKDEKAMLDALVNVLVEEAKLDSIRTMNGEEAEGLTAEQVSLFGPDYFNCTQCHQFYVKERPKSQAPDLRGYMSRKWIAEIIANPTDKKFYASKNDRMPAYHLNEKEAMLSMEEINMIADWLHGKWYRPEKTEKQEEVVEPKSEQEAEAPLSP